jgi:hypothetical protein
MNLHPLFEQRCKNLEMRCIASGDGSIKWKSPECATMATAN